MDAHKKAMVARVLGYICIVAGALNLTIALIGAAETRTPLLGTGIGAIAIGIIMLTRGMQKPAS